MYLDAKWPFVRLLWNCGRIRYPLHGQQFFCEPTEFSEGNTLFFSEEVAFKIGGLCTKSSGVHEVLTVQGIAVILDRKDNRLNLATHLGGFLQLTAQR